MGGLTALLEHLVWGAPAPDAGDPDVAEALAAVDGDVAAYAVRARESVVGARHRGCGSLATMFPRTFPLADPAAFVASAPFGDPALSIEEAFWRYATDAGVGDAATRDDELYTAMTRAVVVQPRPAFSVPMPRVGEGWAVEVRGVVYAAVNGRAIRGTMRR
ncbi:MAG: hypothetical protein ACOZNI_17770 [Myxococcota bacterium]